MATKKAAKKKAASKGGGKLIRNLQSRAEGALSRGCGSQVGALAEFTARGPSKTDAQKPSKK